MHPPPDWSEPGLGDLVDRARADGGLFASDLDLDRDALAFESPVHVALEHLERKGAADGITGDRLAATSGTIPVTGARRSWVAARRVAELAAAAGCAKLGRARGVAIRHGAAKLRVTAGTAHLRDRHLLRVGYALAETRQHDIDVAQVMRWCAAHALARALGIVHTRVTGRAGSATARGGIAAATGAVAVARAAEPSLATVHAFAGRADRKTLHLIADLIVPDTGAIELVDLKVDELFLEAVRTADLLEARALLMRRVGRRGEKPRREEPQRRRLRASYGSHLYVSPGSFGRRVDR